MTTTTAYATRLPPGEIRPLASPLARSPTSADVPLVFWVRPLDTGWCMLSAETEPLMFPHGGDAERQARRMACAVAERGEDAKVNICDRRGVLVTTVRVFGREDAQAVEA